MKKYTCASFFAGVGGIDLGFEETGLFKTVYANEFDSSPVITMKSNFPDVNIECKDIHDVLPNDFPDVDVIMGGFPCQAFSVAGYRQGFEDEKGRGVLFFELLRLIKAKKPRIVFCENVKNLVAHDNGNTFRVICESLEASGYKIKYKVLNAMDYGDVPQNRERIYIVGFREDEDYKNFDFPAPIRLTKKISDVIDFHHKVEEKYFYTKGKFKGDVYEQLEAAMDDPNTVYQWRRKYVRKNQSNVVPTLTANMGEGGHNVPLVRTKYGIRKLTPKECFNVQGFPDNFNLPVELKDAKLYKQAGNSVCVSVIKRIAENIGLAMQSTGKSSYNCKHCGASFEVSTQTNIKVIYCPFCGKKIA